MKKTILMTLAALGLAGMAQADYSVTLDDYYYQGLGGGNASWVYIWTGGDGSATSGSNWGYLQNKNQQALSSSNAQTPIKFDPGFIGFDFNYVDGQQVLTANNEAIVVTAPTWMGNTSGSEFCRVFLGNNVTFQGSNNGFRINGSVNFYFGDMSQTQSSIQMGDFWKQNGTVTFSGTLDMTSSSFEYTLFHSTAMWQNVGTWNADFTITDQNGETLQYAEMGSENVGKDGYYWLEQTGSGTDGGDFTVSIVAQATPEPTTATLSLLALAGLCARRRRK